MTNFSHSSDPLSTDPSHVGGFSRKPGYASYATKVAVISAIENIGAQYGLSQLDIANLIAIAKLESGFNPDAATPSARSSASGVMQVTDSTAKKIFDKYDGTARINGHQLGTYDRFDLNSNIEYGIAIYLDNKAWAHSNDVGDIYKKYNGNPEEYTKYLTSLRKESTKYLQGIQNGATSDELMSYFPSGGPKTRICTPADLNGNGIPDYVEDIKNKFHTATVTRSPIVLDLNGDGINTTGLQDGAYFDHDGNGFAEQTGWVNSEDGILVRDLDGNGTIDNGRELLGSETLLANGQKATNGYQALAALDTNRDGQINQQDAAYTTLQIWKDADGNGYSSADELYTLVDAGVQSIATGYTDVNQTDANGNITQQTGSFTRTDGSAGSTADIWFQVDKTNTIANDWLEETDVIAALPDLQGYGNIRDLHQAMLRDTTGHLQNLAQQFINATDTAARHALTTQVIYAWAGVENIDPASRAASMIYGNAIGDARKLASLEAILGEAYFGTWCWGTRDPNPHGPASIILLQAFDELAASVYSQLMAQTHFKPLLDSIGVTWNTTTNQFDYDVSSTVSALQAIYNADPVNSALTFSEFSDTLKLDGDYGLQVIYALRAQGNLDGEGFVRLLGAIGFNNLIGDAGNNTLRGSVGNDFLYGMAGQDNLYGNAGNDCLEGDTGNDYLEAGAGNDIYIFNLGDGQDIIYEIDSTAGNVDTLRFGAGIAPSDIAAARRDGTSMVLSIAGTTDQNAKSLFRFL